MYRSPLAFLFVLAIAFSGGPSNSATINVPNDDFSRIGSLSGSSYVGQTFTALDGLAQSLTIYLGWRPIDLTVLVTDVTTPGAGYVPGSGGVYYPGNVLFESNVLTAPSTQSPPLVPYTMNLGGLQLTQGGAYAIILDAYSVGTNNPIDPAQVGVATFTGGDAYAGGEYIANNLGPFPSGTRAQHFASGFTAFHPNLDMAFTMSFTNQPAPVPLPASLPMLLGGVVLLAGLRGKKASQQT